MKVVKNKSFIFAVFVVFLFSSCRRVIVSKEVEQEPVEFTFYSSDLYEPLTFDNDIAKEITKKTGVKITFLPRIVVSDEDIDIMIANNNYPDFIFAKGKISKLIEAQAIIPLDDYINKYGTNIKKLYKDEIVKLRNSLEDPSIYSVGTYEIKRKVLETSGTLQIQNAVLKEFGYPKIETLEDYEAILKAYISKYPTINGHETLGLSLLTDSWYWYLFLSNTGNYVIGYPDDGQWIINQKTMKATYKFLYPEMKIFYKWLNKLYHEGLLDPESFTQDITLYQSKLTEGYVLGTASPDYLICDLQWTIVQNSLDSRTYAYLPVVATKNHKDQLLKDYGFSGGWGIAISKDCKDKEKAFKFLDYICSEEAQVLINWGQENIDYYYDPKGVRISYPNIPKERGIGKWIYPFPQAGSGYIDSTGNPIGKSTIDEVIKKYTKAERDTLRAYGATLWADLATPQEELEVSKYGYIWQYSLNNQMNNILSSVDEYVKNALIKMILGPETSFDNSWENMKKNIVDMGINDVENEISNLIAMKLKLWEN